MVGSVTNTWYRLTWNKSGSRHIYAASRNLDLAVRQRI